MEDTPTGTIPFAISDLESSVNALIVTAHSSNPRLVPDQYILIGGSGSDLGLMIVPQLDQFGEADITVEVRDSDGATAAATFTLSVLSVNDKPVISPVANRTLNEDTSSGDDHPHRHG
jgi:hypothetical protein